MFNKCCNDVILTNVHVHMMKALIYSCSVFLLRRWKMRTDANSASPVEGPVTVRSITLVATLDRVRHKNG